MATTTQAQILLLGAKSTERPLAAIPHELSQLKQLFDKHTQSQAFSVEYEPYFTQDQLKSKLNQLQNQVAILHFAGHSDAEGILSDDEVVYSRHIAGHIKSWTIPPALVVLNGCHNAGQVKLFHEAGVSVVIATHRAVNDGLAAGFAHAFYAALLEHPKQTTVQQAFDQASSNALMGENRDAVPYGRSLDIEDDEKYGWDWDVFPQDEAQCEWTFHELITTARPVLDKHGRLYNPYKGLEAFQEEDQSWFFGRENVTQELLTTLLPENNTTQAPRFFSLLGASGSGKSSLVNAGVIPKLREQNANHLILHTRPGNDAFQELAKVLSEQLYLDSASKQLSESEAFAAQLKGTPSILPKQIQLLLNDEQDKSIRHVYLFIDQFEELFTHLEHEQIQHFLQQLTALIESDIACTLGIIMRADFLASALAYPQFGQYIDTQPHKMLSPMSETELRTAIERPAQRQHVSIESSLTENLLNDVEHKPGSLPLLQYVLSLLWEKREARQDKQIKLEDYQAFGGLEKALEQKANSVYQDLSTEQQAICQRIFMRLVQPGEGTEDTRRRAGLHEFNSEAEKAVIKELADARLITTQGQEDTTDTAHSAYAEVSHEALIRTWSQLKEWLAANRDELRTQHQISTGTKDWLEHDKAKDWLLTGTRLSVAEDWLKKNPEYPTPDEKSFIQASIKRQKRKKLLTYALTALTFITLVIIAVIINEQREAAIQENLKANYNLAKVFEEKALLDEQKREAVLKNENVSPLELRQAWLFGLEAAYQDIPEGKQAILPTTLDFLSTIQQQHLSSERKQTPALNIGAINSVAFSPDGKWIASGSDDKTVRLWDAQSGETLKTLQGHTGFVFSVAFSPDGKWIASGSDDKTVHLLSLNYPTYRFAYHFDPKAVSGVLKFIWQMDRDELEFVSKPHTPSLFAHMGYHITWTDETRKYRPLLDMPCPDETKLDQVVRWLESQCAYKEDNPDGKDCKVQRFDNTCGGIREAKHYPLK